MKNKTAINRILRSPITKIAALAVGFFAAVFAVLQHSYSYRYYLETNTGIWPRIPLWISILVFIVCLVLFLVSIWKSDKATEPNALRKIDWTILSVLTVCFVAVCSSIIVDGRFWFMTYQLLVFSLATYLAVMLLLGEIMARVRDRQLWSTFYWGRFFKLYPVKRPIGLLMALLLIFDLLVILNVIVMSLIDIWFAISPLALAVFTLIVLSYFCSFLLSLSEEYDKANAEKIRAERFKAELITNVSHDIRTPLTAVISYVGLLKALPVENPEFDEYTEVLDRKTLRLKTLIDDLMEASKAGTGNLSVDFNEVDLIEITGQVAGEFDEQFTERDLTLVIRQPDSPVTANADRRHLWRALENLFSNAAKYSLPGTRVFAEIINRDNGPVFSLKNVSQNPIDMPAGALTEQFIRGDLARQTEGNGLGLYIAKSLVELMGGEFTIRASGDLFEVEIRFCAPFLQN